MNNPQKPDPLWYRHTCKALDVLIAALIVTIILMVLYGCLVHP